MLMRYFENLIGGRKHNISKDRRHEYPELIEMVKRHNVRRREIEMPGSRSFWVSQDSALAYIERMFGPPREDDYRNHPEGEIVQIERSVYLGKGINVHYFDIKRGIEDYNLIWTEVPEPLDQATLKLFLPSSNTLL